jgi:type II secretory pathway pseudopilin PulG
MMLKTIFKKLCKRGAVQNQNGFTLIEAIIGIGFMSVIAAAILAGVSATYRANALADEQSNGVSVAINQVESLHTQVYKIAASGSEVTYAKIATIPTNFTIWSYNRLGNLVSDIVGVPWSSAMDGTDGVSVTDDAGLQKIRLVVKQGNDEVFTIEVYKVK